MATHVALLRGINLGGRNKVAMADLRQIVTSLGHADVSTYIQSGNVLFDTHGTGTHGTGAQGTGAQGTGAQGTGAQGTSEELAEGIEQAITAELGLNIAVVVVSRDQLARIARDNPYQHETNPKLVHVIFRKSEADQLLIERIAKAQSAAQAKGSRDTITAIGQALYLHTPDGYGTSELAKALARMADSAGDGGTARNWSTTTKLLSLCAGQA